MKIWKEAPRFVKVSLIVMLIMVIGSIIGEIYFGVKIYNSDLPDWVKILYFLK